MPLAPCTKPSPSISTRQLQSPAHTGFQRSVGVPRQSVSGFRSPEPWTPVSDYFAFLSLFPHLSSGLRDERCCSATPGWTVLAMSVAYLAWVPQNSRGLRPPVPLGLPVTGEASMGQVSYLHILPYTPTMIILLLLAQHRPCCGFRSVVIYSQWKLGPPQMVLSYPPASISLHPKGRPLTNFCGPRKCSQGPFLSREDSAPSLG